MLRTDTNPTVAISMLLRNAQEPRRVDKDIGRHDMPHYWHIRSTFQSDLIPMLYVLFFVGFTTRKDMEFALNALGSNMFIPCCLA